MTGSWQGFPLRDACIYELHVGTFTPEGTYDGVASKLDHLVHLGVNAIELMPVHRFAGSRGWGYDVVDLRTTHEPYGSPDDLKRLVAAAHERGLAAICDVVYNHIGPGADISRDFVPHYTSRRSTAWGPAINLDGPYSDEVRAFVVDNALMWMESYGFDGLRIDAIDAIVDTSAVHILEEIGVRTTELGSRLGRTLWLIAESDLNDPRVVWSRDRGGYGMDAQWSDDFHNSLHALLTGERGGYYADFGLVEHLATALRRAFVNDGRYSTYRRRRHGRPADGVPGHQFLGYMQNHDQIGNRARGDRTAALLSPELLRVVAAIVLTAPFVPMLFMGEEWGASTPFPYFTGHDDPILGRTVTDGRKRDFAAFGFDGGDAFDPQEPATFEAARLRWDEIDDPRHSDLLEWHRNLIAQRRELPDLSDGDMSGVRTQHSEDPPWLVMQRGAVIVASNFAPVAVEIPVRSTGAELLLTSGKDPEPTGGHLRLPPQSVSVLSQDGFAGRT
jgi:maltooligosyltrehalose trehalohydrolase